MKQTIATLIVYAVLAIVFIALAIMTLQTMPPDAEARPPKVLVGKSSWYGGPCDGADNNIPAHLPGDRNFTPGVALRRYDTVRRYFLLHSYANGRSVVVRHTDYGPALWTGKLVDINYTAVRGLGYSGCQDDYPSGARVKLKLLHGKKEIRKWAARTKTKLDDARIAGRL